MKYFILILWFTFWSAFSWGLDLDKAASLVVLAIALLPTVLWVDWDV